MSLVTIAEAIENGFNSFSSRPVSESIEGLWHSFLGLSDSPGFMIAISYVILVVTLTKITYIILDFILDSFVGKPKKISFQYRTPSQLREQVKQMSQEQFLELQEALEADTTLQK